MVIVFLDILLQGHVDTTSTIKKINFVGKSWFINFKLSKKYKKYLIQKDLLRN